MDTNKNPWQLYSTMLGVDAVTEKLNAAWEEAKGLAPDKPALERAVLAVKHVRAVMEEYSKFGAADTEPDSYLVYVLVNPHFNVKLSRSDGDLR